MVEAIQSLKHGTENKIKKLFCKRPPQADEKLKSLEGYGQCIEEQRHQTSFNWQKKTFSVNQTMTQQNGSQKVYWK